MTHPYADGQPYQFWNRAMGSVAPGLVDPVVGAPRIGAQERVATLGSCFAQHIARHLQRSGCRYHVVETAPAGLGDDEARERQYGVFSCRYGNVYTVRQALQLVERAFGTFTPVAGAWPRDERWVDPFRPQVEPSGWAGADEVEAARQQHLGHVRTMVETSEWLVFTLGLTEGWVDRRDGAVFPLAPGVAGGDFDAALHAFVNFDVDAVRSDLDALIKHVKQINPRCRWLLTVSPVPLIATAETRHVWTSTTLSKAVLRVAADDAVRRHDHVHYFPSFEVITSPAAGGRYYADDLRQVTDLGVQHVMRLFTRHCLGGSASNAAAGPVLDAAGADDVVCDEETIARAMAAGAGPN